MTPMISQPEALRVTLTVFVRALAIISADSAFVRIFIGRSFASWEKIGRSASLMFPTSGIPALRPFDFRPGVWRVRVPHEPSPSPG